MSVETPSSPEDGSSSSRTQPTQIPSNSSCTETAGQKDTRSKTNDASNAQEEDTSSAQALASKSSLLASLWSPFSSVRNSILSSSQSQDVATSNSRSSGKDAHQEQPVSIEENTSPKQPNQASRESTKDLKSDNLSSSLSPNQNPNPDSKPDSIAKPVPVPYHTPTTTPTYKRLQKLRLSGTRTKQLIRAASRAHDDPPPPPELGSCCGSSCDPCVNDLWREERDVWRERWGDYAVEKGVKKDGASLEW